MSRHILPFTVFLLISCVSRPTPLSPTPTEAPTSAPPAEAATSTIPPPTPTPDIRDVLRDGVESVLGVQAYDADPLREQANTPEEEAALLAAIPPEEQTRFLQRYVEAQAILNNVEEMRETAHNPLDCSRGTHLAINAVNLQLTTWLTNYWGPPNFELLAREAGVPGPSETPYAIIECNHPEGGLQQIEALRAESEDRIVTEEGAAEAVASTLLRDLFHRTFGEQLQTRVEFEQGYPTQLIVYDSGTGEVVGSDYYPFEITQENVQGIVDRLYSDVFDGRPPYTFVFRAPAGFALSSDQSVPVVGTIERLSNISGVINGAVHQLMGSYPLGSAEGRDGTTIAETFAIIAERELFREFITTNYPYLASSGPYSDTYASWFERRFDGEGRHINFPQPFSDAPPLDPREVYGENDLGHAVFELRNCGIERGQTLGEFFDTMKEVDTADQVYAALSH